MNILCFTFFLLFVAYSEIATNVYNIIGCWLSSKRNCSRHSHNHKHTPCPCNCSLVLFFNMSFFWLFYLVSSSFLLHLFTFAFMLAPFFAIIIVRLYAILPDNEYVYESECTPMMDFRICRLLLIWTSCKHYRRIEVHVLIYSCAPLLVICGISCAMCTRNVYFINGNRWAFSYVFYSDDCVHFPRHASLLYISWVNHILIQLFYCFATESLWMNA